MERGLMIPINRDSQDDDGAALNFFNFWTLVLLTDFYLFAAAVRVLLMCSGWEIML